MLCLSVSHSHSYFFKKALFPGCAILVNIMQHKLLSRNIQGCLNVVNGGGKKPGVDRGSARAMPGSTKFLCRSSNR